MHPVQASKWKKEVTERLPEVFAGKSDADAAAAKAREQIGRLKLELEWLKKKLASSSVDQRRRMIEAGHPVLSVERQCELRGLPRATYYHRPRPEPEDNRRLMRLIDETYLAYPFFGSRQMTRWLHRQGERVNANGCSGRCGRWGWKRSAASRICRVRSRGTALTRICRATSK